ncbi:hypothetical protein KA005_14475, partial [bacterium]|nr:hypothetical protein [bacterium]
MLLEKSGNMAKRRLKYTILIILLIGLCLQACIKDTGDDVEITTMPTEKSQLEQDEADIQIEGEKVTQIVIDGNGDDWTSYEVVSSDVLGDQIHGSPDLAEVRAFKNDKYLYIMLKFDEGGYSEQIIFGLGMGGSITYQFNVFLSGMAEISRPIGSTLVPIPVFSAQGEVLEIKVALDEIGGQLQEFHFIETCCFGEDHKRGDKMDCGHILVVNEIEPTISSSNVQEITNRPCHINLGDGTLKAEYLYRSFLQIPVGMAWGTDGYLYVADWTGRHVIRVSKDGDMDDLGLWKTVNALQHDGPRGIAFDSRGNLYINNHGSILRRDISGNVDQLSGITGSPLGSIAISPSDELFYTDRGSGKLLKWTPEDGSKIIASNLPFAENLTFGLDGTLYLTQMGQGDIMKVDIATGEAEIFATDICMFDPCFLAIDPDGDIWVRGIWHLHQFTPEGVEKPFVIDGQTYPGGPYNWHTSGGIAFDDEGGL